MPHAARLQLPDGRLLDFTIRRSARARSVWLRVKPRDGLVVTLPAGVAMAEAMRLVAGRMEWIVRHLHRLDAVAPRGAGSALARPDRLELRALGESWSLGYQETRARALSVHTRGPEQLLIAGDVEDVDACRRVARRWLMGHAKQAFAPWLDALARETGLAYARLGVRAQRGRWGSCNRLGHISLNGKLLFLPREQVRYVMLHELCHTRELNHSPAFWALVRRHEPEYGAHHRALREAWTLIPPWLDAA